ncbi:MAG TPA: hypothetical protein VJA94_09845 [Candidatus Angelobacter sp.]
MEGHAVGLKASPGVQHTDGSAIPGRDPVGIKAHPQAIAAWRAQSPVSASRASKESQAATQPREFTLITPNQQFL